MTSVEKLFACFDNYLPLNDVEKEDVQERVIERRIKRRQFILQEDEV